MSSARVNINTASAADLENLPGIGPSKAAAIAEDRSANGPFATCQDLGRVAGIGPATLANFGSACVTQ
ncbi:MAG: ComEA family DNA-binding protein [Deltaproteobacteria bacterium]|nr:ComEA family DNA-binding protein [Deltaproteobacteria bacterium]